MKFYLKKKFYVSYKTPYTSLQLAKRAILVLLKTLNIALTLKTTHKTFAFNAQSICRYLHMTAVPFKRI